MAKWKDQEITIIDTETTGLDPETARIWEIATLTARGNEKIEESSCLVNPGIEIPNEIVQLCRLNPYDIAEIKVSPSLESFNFLDEADGDIIAGYNLMAYDWPVLTAEFKRIDQKKPRIGALLDVLVMVRRLRAFRFRALGEVFASLCPGKNVGSAHRAAADCRMSWEILQILLPELPDDLDVMILEQAKWRFDRESDFKKYGYWLQTDPKTGALVMNCGKHCGIRLDRVRRDYLSWVLEKSPSWDKPLPAETEAAFRKVLGKQNGIR